MAVLYTPHFMQFFDNNGDPLAGGLLYTYAAGTTTPKATFTTEDGLTQNANPIVLDAAGRCVLFIDGSYKFRLETSLGVLVRETDNISSFQTSAAATGAVNWATADTIASASSVAIGAATSNYIIITGTTTITSFDTIAQGAERILRFNGSLTITHNATSLILPGGSNIVTQAGDVARFISEGSGNWRLIGFTPAAGLIGPSLYAGKVQNGLTLSNNGSDATNDIDIAAGSVVSDDGTVLMRLATGLTKQLDAAWAVGTNQGMRDTGAIADGWWYIYLIQRPDTGVVDVLASVSSSSPTLPTNYTKKAYICAINRASGVIRQFTQIGKEVRWKSLVADVSTATTTVSRTLHTMTVPSGRRVDGIFNAVIASTSGSDMGLLLTSPDDTDEAVNASTGYATVTSGQGATNYYNGGQVVVKTNTSSQIGARGSSANNIRIVTRGWIDNNL